MKNKKKMRIIMITFLVTAIFVSLPFQEAKAETIDQIRKSLDNLINTKDTGSDKQLGTKERVGLLKEVINLSTEQAKELKARLVVMDYKEEKEALWRDETIKRLDNALFFYSENMKSITEEENLTLEKVVFLTEKFKKERDGVYVPLINEINEFIMISRLEKILDTSKNRLDRIQNDLKRLREINFRGIDDLEGFFNEAETFIQEGTLLHKGARELFWTTYELKQEELIIEEMEILDESIELDAQSEPEEVSIQEELKEEMSEEEVSIKSIKNLAGSSLNNIREAYRIFIDMSNLVRELL